MTFEALQIANKEISTIDVKGKQYAEVNQRIKVFRMLFPNGSITTKIESLQEGMCVMSAEVRDEFGSILGVGHAYEKEDSSFINKTSYIENCETSAVGRALGMCGIGIDTSVASAEEVLNAIKQQSESAQITASYIENCETSAVGRALGMCGIGIDTSVASAEEVLNAIKQQSESAQITAAQVKTLESCIPKHGKRIGSDHSSASKDIRILHSETRSDCGKRVSLL